MKMLRDLVITCVVAISLFAGLFTACRCLGASNRAFGAAMGAVAVISISTWLFLQCPFRSSGHFARNAIITLAMGSAVFIGSTIVDSWTNANDFMMAASFTVGYTFVTWLFLHKFLPAFSDGGVVARVPPEERDRLMAQPAPSGHGIVYVYRDDFKGVKWVGYDVALDGLTVAQLKSPRFARLLVASGPHVLTAGPKASAVDIMKVSAGMTKFTLAAGETAIFGVKLKTGSMQVQPGVELVREPDRRAALAKLALIEMVALTAGVTERSQQGR